MLLVLASTILASVTALTNAAHVTEALATCRHEQSFTMRARLTAKLWEQSGDKTLAVEDDSGRALIGDAAPGSVLSSLELGDLLDIRGRILPGGELSGPMLYADSIMRIGHSPVSAPSEVELSDITSGNHDAELITTTAIVREVFHDDIDNSVILFVLTTQNAELYAALSVNPSSVADYEKFINAQVRCSGIVISRDNSYRQMVGHILCIPSPQDIRIINPTTSLFDTPELESSRRYAAADIPKLGRRRVCGCVRACWQGKSMLVQTFGGEPVVVSTGSTAPLPKPGTVIEAVGLPTTDLYYINLTAAIWRNTGWKQTNAVPQNVRIEELFRTSHGRPGVHVPFHGKCIHVEGSVLSLPSDTNSSGIFHIKDGRARLAVDLSECRSILSEITVGCRVGVTGFCIVDADEWHPYSTFPRTRGLSLVPSGPSDVVILSRPSWWTPTKLLVIIGLMLAALLALYTWIHFLNRIVERKSHQLMRERMALARADLRVEERTQLAAELHDSISQILTGIAGQMSASIITIDRDAKQAKAILATADRMLQSCRTTLRYCLADLRSEALDEPDFQTAIKRTLEPIAGDAKLAIRFNVNRSTIPDPLVHTILCIIRELVGNARNHGQATFIRIAGSEDNGQLMFSVTDNGCGFNPDVHPGLQQGHFGLEGIRNRTAGLSGSFIIESTIGKGSRAVIQFPIKRSA